MSGSRSFPLLLLQIRPHRFRIDQADELLSDHLDVFFQDEHLIIEGHRYADFTDTLLDPIQPRAVALDILRALMLLELLLEFPELAVPSIVLRPVAPRQDPDQGDQHQPDRDQDKEHAVYKGGRPEGKVAVEPGASGPVEALG